MSQEQRINKLEDENFDLKCEVESLKEEIENLKKQIPRKISECSEPKVKKISVYLDKLPDNIIQIDKYGGLEFDRYFYDVENERLLMRTVNNKIKVVNDNVRNSKYITMSAVDGSKKSCVYSNLVQFLKSINSNE